MSLSSPPRRRATRRLAAAVLYACCGALPHRAAAQRVESAATYRSPAAAATLRLNAGPASGSAAGFAIYRLPRRAPELFLGFVVSAAVQRQPNGVLAAVAAAQGYLCDLTTGAVQLVPALISIRKIPATGLSEARIQAAPAARGQRFALDTGWMVRVAGWDRLLPAR